jgi:hypothetical protein
MNKGESVSFLMNNYKWNNNFNYNYLKFEIAGKVSVSGNLSSLNGYS